MGLDGSYACLYESARLFPIATESANFACLPVKFRGIAEPPARSTARESILTLKSGPQQPEFGPETYHMGTIGGAENTRVGECNGRFAPRK